MTTDKAIAQWTIDALVEIGVKRIIYSPGSRNTPLIIAGTAHPALDHRTVLDERSAAFQALGESLITGLPVALCCTSGSAIANYHPAVLEAFYSKVPLIVLTADRPLERIGKGEGQTSQQTNFYQPHIGFSAAINESLSREEAESLWSEVRENLQDKSEPVHINLHFEEPLYGQKEPVAPLQLQELPAQPNTTVHDLSTLKDCSNIAVVCGQLHPNTAQQIQANNTIAQSGATWFVDPLSGLLGQPNTVNIDQLVHHKFDGLLSLGGQWMSKFPKFHVRSLGLSAHVHIDKYQAWDLADTSGFTWFNQEIGTLHLPASLSWLKVQTTTKVVPDLPWSDAAAIQAILQKSDQHTVLHLGNSSIPRYMNYFSFKGAMYCNRGVSGIDGSLSTAVGAAAASPEEKHVLILGDQSALYDSNALLELSTLQNLKVYVINNGRGAIFDWLPGTSTTSEEAQGVFSNEHAIRIAALAAAYGCTAIRVSNRDGLNNASEQLIEVWTAEADNKQAYEQLHRAHSSN